MIWTIILAVLASLSLGLTLWQGVAARRFPLHRRTPLSRGVRGITVLKPLKGCDDKTSECLRSWFEQDYAGPIQMLFGVASADDPVCAVVQDLIREFGAPDAAPSKSLPEPESRPRPRSSLPGRSLDACLIVCPESLGANAKVSTLAQLEREARHELFAVSDADVSVPPDLLRHLASSLDDSRIGLVCCFYRQTDAANLAMRWEALAVNADFWSSVLQAQSLKSLDFALGAVMAGPTARLAAIGGFQALVNYLADDYQLGRQISHQGGEIALSPVVVECRSSPMSYPEVWAHQLRWSRTVRVCQPAPYFFSILSNSTLWPLLWLVLRPSGLSLGVAGVCLTVRWLTAWFCERKLVGRAQTRNWWLAPVKDLLQVALWFLSFAGSRVTWRGRNYHVSNGGRLIPES